MKNFLRSIVTAAFVAVLGASAGIPSAAARPTTAYDGVWSVMIYTQAGDCPQSLRYSVRIVGGRVLSDDQAYQVDGTVAPNGETRVVGGRTRPIRQRHRPAVRQPRPGTVAHVDRRVRRPVDGRAAPVQLLIRAGVIVRSCAQRR